MKRLLLILLVLSFYYTNAQEKTKYETGINVIRDTAIYIDQIDESYTYKLVDITNYIPDIKLNIKYATDNNFTGEIIYDTALAFVRTPLAEALQFIQQALNKRGYGLVIMDAYRPYAATVRFYEVYHDTNFVASPYSGSRHNRGAAVDVSLIDLETGEEIQMPTAFDDFSEKANPKYMNLPPNVITNRELLINEMQNHGFKVNNNEWWHFDFIGWQAYPLMDLSFEQLIEINRKK